MSDTFEYDVFLSFSTADEAIVKPVWQELCSSGLRVFWSDATLKKEVGNSWFDIIEKSLVRSRHMILVCSENSMNSKWVQREYRAFFDYCYSPGLRRLVPLLTQGFQAVDLPIFLRELQVGTLNNHPFIQEIIPVLGGVNVEKLQEENRLLREQIASFVKENKRQKLELESMYVEKDQMSSDRKQIANLLEENTSLRKEIELDKKIIRQLEQLQKTTAQEAVEVEKESIRTQGQVNGVMNNRKQLPRKRLNSETKPPKKAATEKEAKDQRSISTTSKLQAEIKKSIAETTVSVGNLPIYIDQQQIKRLFSAAGIVKSVIISTNVYTATATVQMASHEDALRAVRKLKNKDYKGHKLDVRMLFIP